MFRVSIISIFSCSEIFFELFAGKDELIAKFHHAVDLAR